MRAVYLSLYFSGLFTHMSCDYFSFICKCLPLSLYMPRMCVLSFLWHLWLAHFNGNNNSNNNNYGHSHKYNYPNVKHAQNFIKPNLKQWKNRKLLAKYAHKVQKCRNGWNGLKRAETDDDNVDSAKNKRPKRALNALIDKHTQTHAICMYVLHNIYIRYQPTYLAYFLLTNFAGKNCLKMRKAASIPACRSEGAQIHTHTQLHTNT